MKNILPKKFYKATTVIPSYLAWLRFALVCILSEKDIIAHVKKVFNETGFSLEVEFFSNETKNAMQLVSDILVANEMSGTLDWKIEQIKPPLPSRWAVLKTVQAEGNIQHASSSDELFPTQGLPESQPTPATSGGSQENMYELGGSIGATTSGSLKISRKHSLLAAAKRVPFPVTLYLCKNKNLVPNKAKSVYINENMLETLSGLRKELAGASGCSPFQIAMVLTQSDFEPVTSISQIIRDAELVIVMVGYEGSIAKEESSQESFSEEGVRKEILKLSLEKAQKELSELEDRIKSQEVVAKHQGIVAKHQEIVAKHQEIVAKNQKILSQMEVLLMGRKMKEGGFSEAEIQQVINDSTS
jgi:hypothetical protein